MGSATVPVAPAGVPLAEQPRGQATIQCVAMWVPDAFSGTLKAAGETPALLILLVFDPAWDSNKRLHLCWILFDPFAHPVAPNSSTVSMCARFNSRRLLRCSLPQLRFHSISSN